MPSYNKHGVTSRVKLLLTGDSGSGKTTLLSSLANNGYNLRILDFDGGLDILGDYLTKEGTANTYYETLRDTMSKALAFPKALRLIDNWKTEEEDFGPISNWTDKDVLVIDSLTFMANSCMRSVLQQENKKFTDQPAIHHWGAAGRGVEAVIQYITSDEVKCNVVVTTHVQYVEDAAGGKKAYPVVIGAKLPTIIGRYFNCLLRIDVKPSKEGGTRTLRTVSDYKMDLKNTAPSIIEPDAEPNLNKIFEAIKENAKKKMVKS